ncbi:hypothetical protein B4U80_11783 [Leptotrombidium deliense]|uniref:RING-type domain-containing protein n=1 Tax=Leptotrombidium deliense TaxID=299467 RepID=A0A443S2G4_9ACAR|nr:hypothetical protein B4U80_11783 [Leptotrombidium deliense]
MIKPQLERFLRNYIAGKRIEFYCGGAQLSLDEMPAENVEFGGHIGVQIVDMPPEIIEVEEQEILGNPVTNETDDDDEEEVSAPECAICLESLEFTPLEERVMTACCHIFCRVCLQQNFDFDNRNCPICRHLLQGYIEDTYAPA